MGVVVPVRDEAPRFAADPRRRSLIGKVKVAQKQLGLDEDTYRGMLFEVAGKTSAADLSEAELVRVVEHMKQRGFKALPGKARGARGRAADHPMARKARAMWISLYHLNAVNNQSERALEAFARRQLGVEALQWANQAQGYKLIEALKEMAERHGWSQRRIFKDPGRQVHALKHGLAEAILVKMVAQGQAFAGWTIQQASWSLCGIGDPDRVYLPTQELEDITRALGNKLRSYRA